MFDSEVFFAACIAPLVEAFFILGVFNEFADRARLQANLARSHLLLDQVYLTKLGAIKIDGFDGSNVGRVNKMTSYFYMVIDEAVQNGWEEQKAEYYALKLTDMRCWCEELLDLNNIPECPFRTCLLREIFGGYSDEAYKLWKYIQSECAPEDEEEIESCEQPWPEVHEKTAALD